MFLLSKTELITSIPLKSISRIDISFYKSRNENLNIFNLELDFDEDIIPLITSTLECQPILTRRKTYFGIDNDYIIEHKMDLDADIDHYNNFDFILDRGRYPSFQVDVDKFNNNTSNHKSHWQSRQLHYSQVYPKSQELVRIYSREEPESDPHSRSNCKIFNPQDALGSKEETVIYWTASGVGKFELCLAANPNSASRGASGSTDREKKCIWRLVVDVIEDNHFIDSKVDAVNTWLEKIHKIKSTIKIANQETNTEEI
jgi:hypothetical protein